MSKYKLKIAYDGTCYSGWQSQKKANTIQQALEKALAVLLKRQTFLIGASRTDAGVHALEQTAHFQTEHEIQNLKRFLYSLNGLISKDIRVKKIEPADDKFHARYCAKKKTYHYLLSLGTHQDPFERHFFTHIYRKLNLDIMQKACRYFLGRHNFSAFANKSNEGCARTKPVKNLSKLEFVQINNNTYRFELEADGFLYKMVRNIVGTIIETASYKLNLEDIPRILVSKDRRQAGMAAPARGLFLIKVHY